MAESIITNKEIARVDAIKDAAAASKAAHDAMEAQKKLKEAEEKTSGIAYI